MTEKEWFMRILWGRPPHTDGADRMDGMEGMDGRGYACRRV
jgi:hypothetical protein